MTCEVVDAKGGKGRTVVAFDKALINASTSFSGKILRKTDVKGELKSTRNRYDELSI